MAFIDRRLGPALRRKIEPDDLFQEVSAEAVRSLGEVDLGERDPFNWLCQVAERRIIDAHRRFFGSQKRDAGREVSLNAGGGSASTSRPASDQSAGGQHDLGQPGIFARSKANALAGGAGKTAGRTSRSAAAAIPGRLPSKEIAERLGKSDGAVRVMLTRSLAKLQQIFEAMNDSVELRRSTWSTCRAVCSRLRLAFGRNTVARIVMAMSGGVDSSVAAALLRAPATR